MVEPRIYRSRMGGETNTVRETAEEEPLSPCSQLFNSPDFNCAIIVTMGCKVKGNPSAIIDGLKHTLVNHPRFSSILRRARIMRVHQSIEADKDNPPAVLIKISHEVDKEKGHVFQYDKPASEALPLVCKRAHPTLSAPSGDRNRGFNEGSSSGESANSRSVPKGPTVFQAGIFCSTSTGTFQNKKKKSRQRPPAWVRHVRPARSSTCVNLSQRASWSVYVHNRMSPQEVPVGSIRCYKRMRQTHEMKNGKKGQPSWVRTKVRVEEHVIVPDIDPDIENPYQYVEDYISNLTTVPMDLSKPLWEIHLLCLKTSNAESIGLLKIHHSLGDGMSLMSLFLACTRKTSDPEALPTVAVQKKTVWTDLLQDTETPLLAKPGCELKPKRFVHRIISFDDVKLVKNAMNMTVNDVLPGVTQAGLSRYLSRRYDQEATPKFKELMRRIRLRSAIMINVRPNAGIEALADMMAKKSKCRWGNLFGYILLPFSIGLETDPLEYLRRAKVTVDRKKHSLEAVFSMAFFKLILKVLGLKASVVLVRKVIHSTTLTFSNVVGPKGRNYFSRPSVALTIHFQSYANKVIISVTADPIVIPNPHKMCDNLVESLKLIKSSVLERGLYEMEV
ncbi:hypothetical protein HID58_087604 [Brassica napus]|uniref:Diacylglycerol O-acyltransferase n=1 Tax=Brassica napus TaxID=3708 RepID=A0ABQ7XTS5_BRANA|nr:hypothetical protein HID58_087604 [Brassica napus]